MARLLKVSLQAVATLFLVSNAESVPLGPTCVTSGQLNAYKQMLQRASVIGKEDRKPITIVAKSLELSTAEVTQIRGSVGFVVCPGTKFGNPGSATGFLIGSDQKLMTVAHIFRDERGRLREPLADCFFQNQEVPPKKVKLDIGDDLKGLTAGYSSTRVDGMDFAFAKLKDRVAGAHPLKIDSKERELTRSESILTVSAFQHGIKRPDRTQPVAQRCVVRNLDYYRSTIINSDCDMDAGGSGSPVLTRGEDGQLVIRGMMTSVGTHVGDGDDYDLSTGNFALGIGFDGKPFKMMQEFISN